MVTEKITLPLGRYSKKFCGDLSLDLMGETQFSREYAYGFIPDYRHAVEAVGESEGLVGSEDSSAPKRRCISLNAGRCAGFYVPIHVISLSKLTGSKRKTLEMKLRRELEQVQKLQKMFSSTKAKLNVSVPSSSSCPVVKKQECTGQNVSQLKRGIGGRFESTKPVPSAPSFTVLMKQCETLLKRLMAHQYAWVFNVPVDIVKLNIPDYLTVIKQPMDLGTIKSKVASGAYSSPLDFASDVRLTFSNAMTYNPPGNDVHGMADVMSKFFEKRWKQIEKKAISAAASLKREPESAKIALECLKSGSPQKDHIDIGLHGEPKMTDDEKLALSRRLSLMSEFPPNIIDFLKQHTNNANQNSEDEIEIDFDSLSVNALFELKNLLDGFPKGRHLEQQEKNQLCEIEILNGSGLSNSSMHPVKGDGPVDEDEDVDVGDLDPQITSYSHVDRGKNAGSSSSSSSGSESRSSSSDSDSSTTKRSESNYKFAASLNSSKEGKLQGSTCHDKGPVTGLVKHKQDSQLKAISSMENGSQDISHEGENAPSERQISPDKLYRAALLRSRFADTILKAREKTLDQGEKRDPEKVRREREELERQQREERARLQAEAKAAEDARRTAEAEAAAAAKRRRELDREAARQALLLMEKTVEINESSLFLKDLEMLRTVPCEHTSGSSFARNPEDGFKLDGSNPLEQLGLFMKADEEEEGDGPNSFGLNDVEEGEID